MNAFVVVGLGVRWWRLCKKKYGKDIESETDEDAVGFYRKCGFMTQEFVHEKRGKRHTCILKIL